jgi:hypothetical protein
MWRLVTSTFAALTLFATVAAAQQPCTTDANRVVAEVYRHTLERNADPGAQTWVRQLANGQLNVKEVVRRVAKSQEYMQRFGQTEAGEGQPYERAIARLYRHVLGRQPDASGQQYWARMAQQRGFAAAVDGFIDSSEYGGNFGDWGVPGSGGLRFCANGSAAPQSAPQSSQIAPRFRGLDDNGDGVISRPPWNRVGGRGGDSILYEGDTATGGARQAGPAAAGAGGGPDPKLDTMVSFSLYGVIPSPVDDSVWGVSERYPGYLVRMDRGKNPPQSCITEIYKVPEPGFDPRGVDIDTNGVVWTALAASSHLASFDRRKCKAITGPRKVDGSECTEGWTLYQTTGPKLKGTNIPADFHYYNWVDQFNVLGLGANKPIANGSNSDSLLVLDPQTRQWTTLRVPYPLGFYSRGLDGRIDNPNGGWKGRALYANYGTHFVWHIEGGKGTRGKVVKFQLRPDPLAN